MSEIKLLKDLEDIVDEETLAVIYPYREKNLTERIQEREGWIRTVSVSPTPTQEIEMSKKVDMLQKQIDNLNNILTIRPVIRNIILRDLNSSKYSLKENIEISIEEYPDETIAQWPEIEVFGHGVKHPEAVLDLKNEIIDLYEDLSSTKKKELGKLPEMWLRILKKIIKKND